MTKAEARIRLISKREELMHKYMFEEAEVLTVAIEALKDRPKGEWVSRSGCYGVAYCSECNYELRVNNTNFCPNCGADMRGEEK